MKNRTSFGYSLGTSASLPVFHNSLMISWTCFTPAQSNSSTKPSAKGDVYLFTATVRVCPSRVTLAASCCVGRSDINPFCSGGISLSPAFVVMFVMQHYQLSWEDALHLVQNRRYCISPNGGFLTQIKVRKPCLCI